MNRRRLITAIASALAATSLSACSLVPDLAPESLAANKAACDTVTTVWTELSTILESTDLVASLSTLQTLPSQLQSAIDTSTDATLDEALTGLKSQLDALSETALPDVSELATAGASLAARCAVFGVTPDLTLPGM